MVQFVLVGIFHGGHKKVPVEQIFALTVKTFGPFDTEDQAHEFNRLMDGTGGAGVIWTVTPLRDPDQRLDPGGNDHG